MNIGIHFFDLCIWLFGEVHEQQVHLREDRRLSGVMELEKARVRWFLSVEKDDLPEGYLENGRPAFRSLTLDGQELEFSDGFTDLHAVVYKQTLAGNGFRLDDARASIQVVHDIRHSPISTSQDHQHPYLARMLT